MKITRIYLRVSTSDQDLARQEQIVVDAKRAGYYVAGVYRETASGARPDRPALLRLIEDLQDGDVVIAETMDRLSRLPLPEAEKLIASIRSKGARLAVPGIFDLSDLPDQPDGIAKIVLEAVQQMLLKIALHAAHEDYRLRRERQRQGIALARAEGKYRGRQRDSVAHDRIIALRSAGTSIATTAKLAACSAATVKRVWAIHLADAKATTA
jgi:DNA invertase Pin-like site-specific DNA recombinase